MCSVVGVVVFEDVVGVVGVVFQHAASAIELLGCCGAFLERLPVVLRSWSLSDACCGARVRKLVLIFLGAIILSMLCMATPSEQFKAATNNN